MKLMDGLKAIASGQIVHFNGSAVARERVDAGIDFLDREFGPGKWEHKIHVRDLDIKYRDTCMIGQVCGNYNDEVFKESGILAGKSPVVLGFFADRLVSWKMLTEAWIQRLDQRAEDERAYWRAHPELPLAAA